MNNYCTKCGEKLEKNSLVCKKCNTPVIDLPLNYVYKSPKKKKVKNIITIIIISIVGLISLILCYYSLRIATLKKMVRNYIEENYEYSKYSINYFSFGRCKVDSYNTACGGEDIKLKISECRAYYFNANIDGENIDITVFKKGKEYIVREGSYLEDEDNDMELEDIEEYDDIEAQDYQEYYNMELEENMEYYE